MGMCQQNYKPDLTSTKIWLHRNMLMKSSGLMLGHTLITMRWQIALSGQVRTFLPMQPASHCQSRIQILVSLRTYGRPCPKIWTVWIHHPKLLLSFAQQRTMNGRTLHGQAYDYWWSASNMDFTTSLRYLGGHVNDQQTVAYIFGVIIISVWNVHCVWCILSMSWSMLNKTMLKCNIRKYMHLKIDLQTSNAILLPIYLENGNQR